MTDNPGEGPLDAQTLADLERDTSRELIPELVRIYLETATDRAARMTEALAQSDLEAIAGEAHALKSSSATFGATEVQKLSLKIEIHAKEGDRVTIAGLMPDLTDQMAAAETALRQHVQQIEAE